MSLRTSLIVGLSLLISVGIIMLVVQLREMGDLAPTPAPITPSATPNTPSATPTPPSTTPNTPSATPTTPSATPNTPSTTPTTPSATPTTPSATPTTPSTTPTTPSTTPTTPSTTPTTPSTTPTTPSTTPTTPSTTPTTPSTTPTTPSTTPTTPSTTPTTPSTTPTTPSATPTTPSTTPTTPSTTPTTPSTTPTIPSTTPTTPSTTPTTPSTTPTTPSTTPTIPSTTPTTPSTTPTTPSTTPTTPSTTPTTPPTTVARRPQCGKRNNVPVSRVENGEESIPHSWPWAVYIMRPDGTFRFGATLINDSFVAIYYASVGDYAVFGAHNRSSTSEPTQKILIEEIYRHPNQTRPLDGMWLARLAHPVNFTNHVGPICLPQADDVLPAGSKCVIVGWGSYPGVTDLLHEVNVTVITNQQCREAWTSDMHDLITKYTICTASGGARPSWRDRGGALMCVKDSDWFVQGVLFYGHSKRPAMYWNFPLMVPWINP